MISAIRSRWRPVTSSVLQKPALDLVLSDILINGLDDGTECTLSKLADDRTLGGFTDKPDGCTAIQRDLSRLEK